MQISIVIPFKNEKGEVSRTITEIRKFSNCEIILINDASDDGYDYNASLDCFSGVRLITNLNSLGVAQCRDMGVSVAFNEYILLLDAHMRISNDIFTPLVEQLYRSNNTLLCLNTKFWIYHNGKLYPTTGESSCKGMYIDFDSNIWHGEWIHSTKTDALLDVPCVMGAAYAFHKSYYQYLHGLMGLEGWGMDEQLLSVKYWLSGGKCSLMNNVEIGHVYRHTYPYVISNDILNANKLFLTRLFLPELEQSLIGCYSDDVIALADGRNEVLEQERDYLKSISVRDMNFVLNLNKVFNDNDDVKNTLPKQKTIKNVKIIYNNVIPLSGFKAINLFGVLFARCEFKGKLTPQTINHEKIHTRQMKEMLYIFFYVWYIIEWLIRLFGKNSYRNISFEREAYENQDNERYLEGRRFWSFTKYIQKK